MISKPLNIIYIITGSIMGTIGLLYNSPPVVLGSMLVSPLNMPIMDIIKNILKNNTQKSIFKFISLSVFVIVAYIIGLSIGYINTYHNYFKTPTPEMNARTSYPYIIGDIFIAFFGGVAVSYAVKFDDYVAISGVALIIAYLPPILNSGLFHGMYLHDKTPSDFDKGVISMKIALTNMLFVFIGALIGSIIQTT